MYVLICEIKVIKGQESDFEYNWAKWTDAIYRCGGSLGSRLHKTETPSLYLAYAQWPSKEAYEKEVSLDDFSEDEIEARDQMKAVTEKVKIIQHLVVANDRLKRRTADKL